MATVGDLRKCAQSEFDWQAINIIRNQQNKIKALESMIKELEEKFDKATKPNG
jgi:hypothetical protein